MNRILLPVIALLAASVTGYSQETGSGQPVDTADVKNPVRASAAGYASWLHMAMFEKPEDPWINSTMLHNRLNFKAYPGSRTTVALEVRNRFVTGDLVSMDPSYTPGLAYDPGWVDMSWNITSGTSYVLNTMIDRAYIDFIAGRLQVRAGRQRINWSQALVWNPNDIFNTYSYFDFDYVERPGSDALRLTYSTSPSSAAEAVVKLNSENEVTAAALYRFSILNTDIQFLAGETDEELLTAGMGWSGAAGSYSIRGEATLFAPFGSSAENKDIFIITAGVDRAFSDKITALLQVMYSNNPAPLNSFTELYRGGMTASQLAFSEFSAIGQVTYAPIPLLNISLSGIWYPDLDGFYAGPSIDFSLAENVDFTFLWQYFNSIIGEEEMRVNLGFVRIRYNF